MIPELKKGQFLIASPEVTGSIFSRSVILLCEYGSGGSFGLIINKNLNLEMPKDLLSVENFSNPHIEIRAGGPVQTNQMMLLHTCDTIKDQTMEVCPGVFLGGDLKFLQEAISEEKGPHVYLCFGYAGWSTPQLDKEFNSKSWFTFPSSKELLFEEKADTLWKTLLEKMGGSYATLAMIPEDLSLN